MSARVAAVIVLCFSVGHCQGVAHAEDTAATNSNRHLRPVAKVVATDAKSSPQVQLHAQAPVIVKDLLKGHDQHSAVQGKPKRELMGMIDAFRAEVCADLKDEHGKNFESFGECKKFMEGACNPGKDKVMDGDGSEVTSKQGFCEEYFHVKEAEKEIEKIDKVEAPAPATAPAPAPEQVAPAPAPAPAPEPPTTTAAAPAPAASASAPAAAAGPAPSPGPAPVADDEAWYYKEGGKWSGRMHMDADLKLPTQGYWGKLVEHEDKKTVTGDWGEEFGPIAEHRTYRDICKEHPDNVWCQANLPQKHSAGSRASHPLIALTMAAIMWGMQ